MRLSFMLFLIILKIVSFSQPTDKRLQRKLKETVKGFNGVVGIYVKNIRTGKIITINADTVFPTASIVKVPILIGIMEKINSGEMNYDSVLVYKDSLLYEGEDILGSLYVTNVFVSIVISVVAPPASAILATTFFNFSCTSCCILLSKVRMVPYNMHSSGIILLLIPPSILPTLITTGAFVSSDCRLTMFCNPWMICAEIAMGSIPSHGWEP